MIFHSLYQWASLLALFLATGAALWRGGWPERLAGGGMITAWVATSLFQNGVQMWGPQSGVMIIDSVLLALLVVIALKSNRWWPMWACGFHAMSVVLHLTVIIDPKVWGRAYFVAIGAFSYLALAALFFGAMTTPPRRTRPLEPDPAEP